MADKALIKVLPEYLDYINIFIFDCVIELPENTGINKHIIELVEGKQLPYGPIYSLGLMELEILKTNIETHLKSGFIWPFKSLVDTPIFSNQKLDGSFRLCIDYRGLNNLTIKNQYLLPLIDKALDRLGQAKYFT